MRGLILAVVVGLCLASSAAKAATTLQLICGRYDAQWPGVRDGADAAAKRRFVASIPVDCPLKTKAGAELARLSARAAPTRTPAEARPAQSARSHPAEAPPANSALSQIDTPPVDTDPTDSKLLDNIAASIAGGGPKKAQPPPVQAQLPSPPPPPVAQPPQQVMASIAPPFATPMGGPPSPYPPLAPGVLPPLPPYQPLPQITLPPSFCSIENRNAFIETVTTPAYKIALHNVELANSYLDWLNVLSAQYGAMGSGHQIPVVKTAQAYQPVAAEVLATSNRYLQLDRDVRKVPVVACADGAR